MFLSKLSLQISLPGVRQSLVNCQDMHRTLMMAFDCDRKEAGLLYRVMVDEHNIWIYAQSAVCPQWQRIEKNGFLCEKVKDISLLPEKLSNQMILHFSLLACPTKKKCHSGKNSKRVILRSEEERSDWLKRQGEKYGFKLHESHESGTDTVVRGSKASGKFTLSGVLFQGVLEITDHDLFNNALQQGIGAEKAYGFGMLMIGRG